MSTHSAFSTAHWAHTTLSVRKNFGGFTMNGITEDQEDMMGLIRSPLNHVANLIWHETLIFTRNLFKHCYLQ